MEKQDDFVYDAWLAGLLGRDVYRISADDKFINKAGRSSSPAGRRLKELQASKVFMYAKVPVANPGAVGFFEGHGFRLVDTNISLEKPVAKGSKVEGCASLRLVVPADRGPVAALAGRSFTYSRFHQDGSFPAGFAEKTRTEWVNGYFNGSRGDAMVVAVDGDEIIGFLLLIYGQDGRLIIDLIAVAESHRRRGVAGDMIRYAETECRGFTGIRVGTQLANLPSLRLYEGMGFKITAAQYTFHYHHG